MMEQLFFAVLEASVTASIAAALVLLIAPTAKKRFAAKWRYWVWLALSVRLLLPISFALPQAPVTVFVPTQQVVITYVGLQEPAADDSTISDSSSLMESDLPEADVNNISEPSISQKPNSNGTADDLHGSAVPSQQPQSYTLALSSVLAYLWLAGAVVALLLQIISALRFSHQTMRWNKSVADTPLEGILESLKEELAICAPLSIYENCRIASPMIIGLLRPCVLLPETALSAKECEFVLRHELTHYKRHDLWYKLLLMLARCIHWFNPMMALIVREAENDIEISCDESVISGRDVQFRQEYCETILHLLRSGKQRIPALSTGFNGNKKVLKKRFEAVLLARSRRGVLPAIIVLAALAVCGLLFACGAVKAPEVESSELPHADEESVAESYFLPLEALDIDQQSLSQLEAVQTAAQEYRVDISDWTELYTWDRTGTDNVLYRVAVYEKPAGVDTSYVAKYIGSFPTSSNIYTLMDTSQDVDRVVVEYLRYLPIEGDSTPPSQGYTEEATLSFYSEAESGFGSFQHAKLYWGGEGDWWQYSFYNPDTGVTLCCTPPYRFAFSITNYGDGPFLDFNYRQPSSLSPYGDRYCVIFYNEQWQQIDGYGENDCYDVAVYDMQTNTITVIGEQLPSAYGDFPGFIDENAGLFILRQVYNNDSHNVSAFMTVYNIANPSEPVAVLDESILPLLPEGATHWCIDTELFVDDSYADGPYALMFYPYIPGKMPVTVNGNHEKSGVNWYIATLDKNFKVTEVIDTGLAMWGTQAYCSSPADVILRDGLLYFSYYFNDEEVFQRERWVYNIIDSAHSRQLLETTMPDSYFN